MICRNEFLSVNYQSFSNDTLSNFLSSVTNILVNLVSFEMPILFLSDFLFINERGNNTKKKMMDNKMVPLILPRNSPIFIQALLIHFLAVIEKTDIKPIPKAN